METTQIVMSTLKNMNDRDAFTKLTKEIVAWLEK